MQNLSWKNHRSTPSSQGDFWLAAMALLASGAAALGHQMLWTRRMIDLLGASAESNARVFECFFLGLSLGAALAARFLPSIRRPWRTLALLELGVALLCVPALTLPAWTGWIWPAIGTSGLLGWPGFAAKLALSVLIIFPAAVLMGMTFPIMVSALQANRSALASLEIRLYSVNTFGGVAGLGLVVLVALPMAGAGGSMLAMIGLNLLVAGVCFSRSRRETENQPPLYHTGDAPSKAGTRATTDTASLLLAFSSGAGVLAFEVLILAVINLKAPLAFYPQGAVLICVILLLAIAAWLVPTLLRHCAPSAPIPPAAMIMAGALIPTVPLIFMNLPGTDLGVFGYGRGFADFLARLTRNTFLAAGPAIILAGSVFPLLMGKIDPQAERGRALARLLAINGLGAIFGAEVAHRVLLPQFGPHMAVGIVGVAYASAGISVLLAGRRKQPGPLIFAFAGFCVAAIVTGKCLPQLPLFFGDEDAQLLEVRCGREGTLAVVENPKRGRAMVFDNLYLLGGTSVAADMNREAHLPLLLHPDPKRVAFIGLGTGLTGAGALQHKAVKRITAIELSPLVVDAARRQFSQFNDGICNDPRVEIQVEDARTYLLAAREQFEVVVGDLFTPWRPGEASLSSLEQFRAARRALRPGGVFCQWFQMSQWTPQQFEMAVATFKEAFGEVYLFRNHLRATSAPLALIGFKDTQLNWDIVNQRCDFESQQGAVRDPLCRHIDGVAMLYLGKAATVPPTTPLNTLNNLRIELSASRQLVAENPANCFASDGPMWFQFLETQLTALESQKDLRADLIKLPRVGLLATQLSAAELAENPAAQILREQLLAWLPPEVMGDASADWSLWQGLPRPSTAAANPLH